MGRIVFAWELGSNFGHLSPLLPVAQELRGRGHRIDFVIRELARGQTVLRPHGLDMLQAPLWTGRTPPMAAAANYAGILQRCGYHTVPALAGLVAGWRRLYELIAPDLVVLDHAPTASLAAQCDGLRTVRIGTGWAAPPDISPLPPLARVADDRPLRKAEAQVLAVANAVLAAIGTPPLERLAQLFRPRAEFLTTFAELDHYDARPGARYYGATQRSVSATAPSWPDAAPGASRLFAFVEAGYGGFDALVADLAALGLPTILYARDLPVRKARLASTPSLRIVAAPIDMDRAVREADLVICHGGHGAIATALLAGTPLLLLPRQSEQRLLAGRVGKLGAGLALPSATPDHRAAIRRLLAEEGFTAAAKAFADRHAGHDIGAAALAIADGCDAVLAAGPPR